MSREYTQEEVQEQFMRYIANLVKYWARIHKNDAEQALSGMAFSFLSMLDGCAMDMPRFLVVPDPHPDDMSYHIQEGENYYRPLPEAVNDLPDVHGCSMIHEFWHNYDPFSPKK